MNGSGSGAPRWRSGEGRLFGQNPSPWVGGNELDRRRTKERAKTAGESEGDAKSLDGLLGAYMRRSSLGAALLPSSPRFLDAWKRAAGDALALRARPVRMDGGVLELEVADPAWKFELRYREAELLEALRREGIEVRQVRAR